MSGGASFKRKFSDEKFKIFDAADQTKQLQFELSAISTGTIRNIIMPDSDVNLSTSGGTFQPSSATLTDIAGLNVTKGNLIVGDGSNWVEVGIGTNDQVLTADSTESAGVKWADAGSGSGTVTGPVSSTNTAIARWSGTTGETLLDSDILIDNSANISAINNLKLNISPSAGTGEGTIYWDATDHAIAVKNDISDTTLQVGQELIIRVRNESGAQINNGQLVYASGAEAGGESRPLISLAKADSATTASVIGAATHDIGNNEYGYVASFGLVRDIDTSSFSGGDPLYLSADTAGATTATEPASPNFSKSVGFVITSDASTGSMFVAITPDTSTPAGDATEITLNVLKDSAGTINPGDVVYQSGYNVGQSKILVELADADDATKMPALGIARDTITNSASGTIVISGTITGQNTAAYSVGDQLYVDTTAGTLTNVRPTAATTAVQKIGQVTRSNASNGVINVVGAGRTNDIPNYQSDAIFRIADDGDTTKLIQFQASGLTTATTRTITMPDKNITLGKAPKEYWFAAESLQPLETNFAPLEKLTGTNQKVYVRAFDDTTEEYANGKIQVPGDIDTSGTVTFRAYVMAKTAAASKNVAMTFGHLAINNSEDFDQTFTDEDSGDVAIDATQDDVTEVTWTETVTNLGWAANDLVLFRYSRYAASANNLSGDLYLFSLAIEIPRS